MKSNTYNVMEASIRGAFDLATFKRFEDQFDAYNYARDNLHLLGKGSGRVAYAYSSGKVLKLAMNEKGFAQNEVEVSVSSRPETRGIIARIYEHDPGMMWVLAELVRPIRDHEEFLRYIKFHDVGVYETGDTMAYVVDDIVSNEYEGQFANEVDPVFVQQLHTVVIENGLDVSDIVSMRSWGKTSDGRLVLLDYGFSHDVAAKHYQDV